MILSFLQSVAWTFWSNGEFALLKIAAATTWWELFALYSTRLKFYGRFKNPFLTSTHFYHFAGVHSSSLITLLWFKMVIPLAKWTSPQALTTSFTTVMISKRSWEIRHGASVSRTAHAGKKKKKKQSSKFSTAACQQLLILIFLSSLFFQVLRIHGQ